MERSVSSPLLRRVLSRSISVGSGKEYQQLLRSTSSQPLFIDVDKRPDLDLVFPPSRSISHSTAPEDDVDQEAFDEGEDEESLVAETAAEDPQQYDGATSFKARSCETLRRAHPIVRRSLSATPLVYRSERMREHHQRDYKHAVFVPMLLVRPLPTPRSSSRRPPMDVETDPVAPRSMSETAKDSVVLASISGSVDGTSDENQWDAIPRYTFNRHQHRPVPRDMHHRSRSRVRHATLESSFASERAHYGSGSAASPTMLTPFVPGPATLDLAQPASDRIREAVLAFPTEFAFQVTQSAGQDEIQISMALKDLVSAYVDDRMNDLHCLVSEANDRVTLLHQAATAAPLDDRPLMTESERAAAAFARQAARPTVNADSPPSRVPPGWELGPVALARVPRRDPSLSVEDSDHHPRLHWGGVAREEGKRAWNRVKAWVKKGARRVPQGRARDWEIAAKAI